MGLISYEREPAANFAQGVEVFNPPRTANIVLLQAENCIIRATFDGTTATPTHGIRLFPWHHPSPFLIDDFIRISFIIEDPYLGPPNPRFQDVDCGAGVEYFGPPIINDSSDIFAFEEESSILSSSSSSL